MPKSNTPYDPQPARQDALGEMAGKGYQAVPGDHASRLKAMQNKLGLPVEGVSPPEAVVRSMRPRRWLAIAAGVAALFVAGIALLTYEGGDMPVALVVDQAQAEAGEASFQDTQDTQASKAIQAPEIGDKDLATLQALLEEEPAREEVLSASQQKALQRPGLESVSAEVIPEPREPVQTFSETRATPRVRVATPSTSAIREALSSEMADAPSEESAPAATDMIEPAAQAQRKKVLKDDSAPTVDTPSDKIVGAEAASRFRMERAASAVATREVTGEVLEPSGLPVIGAVLQIEETGQRVVTDEKGEFTILVTSEAVVGDVSAPGHNPLLFDITIGDEYRLILPRISSSIPSAELKGKAVSLRIIAPNAPRFEDFDEHVKQQKIALEGDSVTVQFEVNRFGRPRQIVAGPGFQDRNAVKKVKELLRSGPDWPEVYRRKSWRYTINSK